MSETELRRHLSFKKIPMFEPLSAKELKRLEDSAVVRTYADGAVIIQQGETQASEFFAVLSGSCTGTRVMADEPGYAKVEIVHLGEGDHFGELALLTHTARAATVTADGECKVAVVHKSQFEDILGGLKEKLQQNASSRYSIQGKLEKSIPRHRSFMHKPAITDARVKHAPPESYTIAISELPQHLQSLLPASRLIGVRSEQSLVPPMKKSVTFHLVDKRGFHSSSRLTLASQSDLDAALSRERATGLGECDTTGTLLNRSGPVVMQIQTLQDGKEYCLLFNPKSSSQTVRGERSSSIASSSAAGIPGLSLEDSRARVSSARW